jgi:hypothetical protein
MYGLVNRAVQDLVVQKYGEQTWQAIRARAEVDDDHFVSLYVYTDAVTYGLIGAAAAELQVSPAAVLEEVGAHWVSFARTQGYGELFSFAGTDLWSFLDRLDALHARLGMTYPEMRPPSFRCTDVDETRLTLHYYSEREGLAPFVLGLLRGLAELFGETLHIVQQQSKTAGQNHDVFLLERKRR